MYINSIRDTITAARNVLFYSGLLVAGLLTGCGGEDQTVSDATEPPVIDVTATEYAFQAPDTIPSGWVTFRMDNQGEETHYFQLNRLPDGHTFEEFRREFVAPRDSLRQLHQAGEISQSEFEKALSQANPEWLGEDFDENAGGMPLVAPGRMAQHTVKMEPGTYAMACVALKSPEGRMHVYLGMLSPITVTEASTDASPPEPDVTIRVAGHKVDMEGSFQAGEQIGAFHVEEASADMEDYYWSALLARIESEAELDSLRAWIEKGDLRNPAPAEFVGGFEYIDPGDTSYAKLDLSPGRYALHMHGQQDSIRTFTLE